MEDGPWPVIGTLGSHQLSLGPSFMPLRWGEELWGCSHERSSELVTTAQLSTLSSGDIRRTRQSAPFPATFLESYLFSSC